MTSNQNANWCVTKPWFDYIMGTRVLTDVSHTETNPLAIKMPPLLEKKVNRAARRLLPKAYAKIDANTQLDQHNLRQGIEIAL
jgi:hypothetical protein